MKRLRTAREALWMLLLKIKKAIKNGKYEFLVTECPLCIYSMDEEDEDKDDYDCRKCIVWKGQEDRCGMVCAEYHPKGFKRTFGSFVDRKNIIEVNYKTKRWFEAYLEEMKEKLKSIKR